MDALREDSSLALGLNTYEGKLTFAGVAEAFGLPLTATSEVLA